MAPVDVDEVTLEEVIGTATAILAASLDATSALTSLTVLSVLRDEEYTARVKSDPARRAKPAAEESLRYWTVIQHGPLRIATADIEIGGRVIQRGDRVMLLLHSANRHSDVFDPAPAATGRLGPGGIRSRRSRGGRARPPDGRRWSQKRTLVAPHSPITPLLQGFDRIHGVWATMGS